MYSSLYHFLDIDFLSYAGKGVFFVPSPFAPTPVKPIYMLLNRVSSAPGSAFLRPNATLSRTALFPYLKSCPDAPDEPL